MGPQSQRPEAPWSSRSATWCFAAVIIASSSPTFLVAWLVQHVNPSENGVRDGQIHSGSTCRSLQEASIIRQTVHDGYGLTLRPFFSIGSFATTRSETSSAGARVRLHWQFFSGHRQRCFALVRTTRF
jgi:hypothetical protein